MTNIAEKTVYMPRIAAELRRRGFQILRVEVNPKKPQYDCYVFEATPEMLEAFGEIANK